MTLSQTTITEILRTLNPKLPLGDAARYAETVVGEVEGGRLPTARRVMSEALRWRSVKEEG